MLNGKLTPAEGRHLAPGVHNPGGGGERMRPAARANCYCNSRLAFANRANRLRFCFAASGAAAVSIGVGNGVSATGRNGGVGGLGGVGAPPDGV